MADIKMGTLYELNKTQMAKEGQLKPNEIKKKLKEKVKPFLKKSTDMYFMLLCKELSDYTIFNFNAKEEEDIDNSLKDLSECLTNRGSVISIDTLKETNDAVEIWLKINDEAFMYYLFPCEAFIIEIGKKYV